MDMFRRQALTFPAAPKLSNCNMNMDVQLDRAFYFPGDTVNGVVFM